MAASSRDHRTTVLVLGWSIAAAVALVDGGPWSTRVRLTVAGGSLEVVGFTLLALDIIAQPAAILARASAAALARVFRQLASLFVRRSAVIRGSSASVGIRAGGAIGAKGHALPDDPLEALRLRLKLLEERVAQAEARFAQEVEALRTDLARLREELQALITRSIEESKSAYYEWRVAGFGVALVGSALLSLANLGP
jgi:hypothetical protein